MKFSHRGINTCEGQPGAREDLGVSEELRTGERAVAKSKRKPGEDRGGRRPEVVRAALQSRRWESVGSPQTGVQGREQAVVAVEGQVGRHGGK